MTDEAKQIVAALRTDCAEQAMCADCPLSDWCLSGGTYLMRDEAADLIEALATELEQVKQERDGLNILLGQAQSMLETRTRERDAAARDMTLGRICETCRNHNNSATSKCMGCLSWHSNWQWRGVREEELK